MKVRLTALLILLALAFGVLAACSGDSGGSGDSDSVVGRWESAVAGDDSWYHFLEDGTGTRDIFGVVEEFTWQILGGRLVLSSGGVDDAWGFSIRRNTLTFTHDLMPGYEFQFNRAN